MHFTVYELCFLASDAKYDTGHHNEKTWQKEKLANVFYWAKLRLVIWNDYFGCFEAKKGNWIAKVNGQAGHQ